MKATKVNAGLAESNGRLLLGIWRDSLHVTCGLTACTPESAPGPTLGNEYGKLYLLPLISPRPQSLSFPLDVPSARGHFRLLLHITHQSFVNTNVRPCVVVIHFVKTMFKLMTIFKVSLQMRIVKYSSRNSICGWGPQSAHLFSSIGRCCECWAFYCVHAGKMCHYLRMIDDPRRPDNRRSSSADCQLDVHCATVSRLCRCNCDRSAVCSSCDRYMYVLRAFDRNVCYCECDVDSLTSLCSAQDGG